MFATICDVQHLRPSSVITDVEQNSFRGVRDKVWKLQKQNNKEKKNCVCVCVRVIVRVRERASAGEKTQSIIDTAAANNKKVWKLWALSP